MEQKEFSYKQAMEELEQILSEIESDEPDIDTLSIKVKRATFLIKECKKRLRQTAEEIDGILNNWEDEE
ncbi:MAG: exodeoxyribonuclease VII small subunit [Bacteroidales bacterium]|jgi:exodeoxyribonuclease VII small subunit|nr:exodeoxyribonuclease VII small subunit [Bacteroidales bacterium]HOL97136.1 exodeoxyribonuclease VII small subunit [Bacteroidales bacterium]HOM35429.1 exodeoxyribonuclease VII small subunit [Bacteroidales bacterium]HPD23080.1 exodeoxyribonuclease VII small subunit [Bacteroidales bacterium]HRS99368.1 exodeoxyribonuclease VII small subunit [Bacteroidales bacterium]